MVNVDEPVYAIAPHSNDHSDVPYAGRNLSRSLPSASVIVNTYNKLPLLRRCMSALGAQTCCPEDWEVILVDDGSSDGTSEWAETVEDEHPHLRGRFRYIWQDDLGYRLARARSAGVAASEKDVVVFLDGDLIPVSDWLYRHLCPYTYADNICVTGIYLNVDPSKLSSTPDIAELEGARVRDRWRGKFEDWREADIFESQNLSRQTRMPVWYMVCGGNTSYNRELLIDAGCFDWGFEGWGAEDNDMAFRYYINGNRIIPSWSALAYHQDHDFDRVVRQQQVERNANMLQSKSASPLVTFISDNVEVLRRWGAGCPSELGTDAELIWIGEPRYRGSWDARLRVVRGGLLRALSVARGRVTVFPSCPKQLCNRSSLFESAIESGLASDGDLYVYRTADLLRQWPSGLTAVDHDIVLAALAKGGTLNGHSGMF